MLLKSLILLLYIIKLVSSLNNLPQQKTHQLYRRGKENEADKHLRDKEDEADKNLRDCLLAFLNQDPAVEPEDDYNDADPKGDAALLPQQGKQGQVKRNEKKNWWGPFKEELRKAKVSLPDDEKELKKMKSALTWFICNESTQWGVDRKVAFENYVDKTVTKAGKTRDGQDLPP